MVDALGAIDRQLPARVVFYAGLRRSKAQHLDVRMKTNWAELVSQWPTHQARRPHPPAGWRPCLLARCDIGRVPKVIKQIPLSILFQQADEPQAKDQAWITALASMRPRLAVLADLGPGSARIRLLKYLQILDQAGH